MGLGNNKIFEFTNFILSKDKPFTLEDILSELNEEEFSKEFCIKRLETLKEYGLIVQSGSYYVKC